MGEDTDNSVCFKAKDEKEKEEKHKKDEDEAAKHAILNGKPLPLLPGLSINPGVNEKRKADAKAPKMIEYEIPKDYHIHMKSHGQY